MKDILNKSVNLHPNCNGGESVLATVMFDSADRMMILGLDSTCYGNYSYSLQIIFYSPNEMINLANALTEVANAARTEFQKNP